MRSWLIAAMALALTSFAEPAAAQGVCRLDDTGSVCVCRRDGGWRIAPQRLCRARAEAPRAPYDEDDYDPSRAYVEDDDVLPGEERTAPRRAPSRRAPAEPQLSAADRRERSEIAEIQRVLNALGCEAGAEDGVVGPGTRAAIRCFQAGALQPITGQLTRAERAALLRAAPELPLPPSTLFTGLRADLEPGAGVEIAAEEPASPAVDDALEAFPEGEEVATRRRSSIQPNAAPEASADAPPPPPAPEIAAEAAAPESEPEVAEASATPSRPERCVDGFSAGAWTYQEQDSGRRAAANATTQNGGAVAFVVIQDPISWRIEILFADGAYVQTLIDTTQYLFIQTDKPAAIGFEDVSQFEGRKLVIPVGVANTVAMLSSETLTLAAAGKNSAPSGELTLFDLSRVPTTGLARVLECL